MARPLKSTTKFSVGQDAEQSLVMQSFYDRNFGRPKQTVFPQSALDGFPVSTYMAYNDLGVLKRQGLVADYNATTPESSKFIRELTAVDGRGLTTGRQSPA